MRGRSGGNHAALRAPSAPERAASEPDDRQLMPDAQGSRADASASRYILPNIQRGQPADTVSACPARPIGPGRGACNFKSNAGSPRRIAPSVDQRGGVARAPCSIRGWEGRVGFI